MNLDVNLGGAGTSFCADTVVCPLKMAPSVRTNKRPAKPSNIRLLGELTPWFAGSAIQLLNISHVFYEYLKNSKDRFENKVFF